MEGVFGSNHLDYLEALARLVAESYLDWQGTDTSKQLACLLMITNYRKGEQIPRYPPHDVLLSRFSAPGRTDNLRLFIESLHSATPYSPCTTPVGDLAPITITELCVETHHRGRYLVARVITPPRRMMGTVVLIEDSQKNIALLDLRHLHLEKAQSPTDLIDLGCLLLIKEPFFRYHIEGDYGLRVDHLSDIVVLNDRDSRLPISWRNIVGGVMVTADALKLKGNVCMSQKKYREAIQV